MRKLRTPVVPDVSANELLSFHVLFPADFFMSKSRESEDATETTSETEDAVSDTHLYGTFYLLEITSK